MENTETVSMGTILYSSWGYDQTNVNFYQVVKMTKSSVYLREICADYVSNGAMQGKKMPRKDEFKIGFYNEPSEPFLRRIGTGYRGQIMIKIDNCSFAYVWDGKAKEVSSWH